LSPSVPFREVSGRPAELLNEFGAEVSDLYRALANNEEFLAMWIGMAWGLRTRAETPRILRELIILRCAHVQAAAYQWADHTIMALAAGVSPAQIAAIPEWQHSDLFDDEEVAALSLTDGMLAGHVSDDALALLDENFKPSERVELIMIAGFYCMVPRVLDALRLPVDVDDSDL
jgi:4-carboxymuconolactone decarboxylase